MLLFLVQRKILGILKGRKKANNNHSIKMSRKNLADSKQFRSFAIAKEKQPGC